MGGACGLEGKGGARHGRRPLRVDAGGWVASTLIANPRPAIVSASALGAQQAAPLRGGYALRELLGADEVAAAILLPAGFVVLVAEGLFLAEAGRADAIGRDAQQDQGLLDGTGATI